MYENIYEFYLSAEYLPSKFVYPLAYIELVKGELPDLKPWHFIYSKLNYMFLGLKERYPSRTLIPFARRGDNDDVACFDAAITCNNPRVIIIHDFASPGYENRGEFADFNEWLEFAKNESIEWKEYWADHNKQK